MYKKIQYPVEVYNFTNLLKDLYGVESLELLHESLTSEYSIPDGIDGLGYDTASVFHRRLYDKLGSGWEEIESLYKKFILEVVKPLFPQEDKLIYQAFPSYRIQYPDNKAITTVHTDSDKDHQHPTGEINFIIPLTEMRDSSAPWVESFPGAGDHSPMEGCPKDLFMWYGNKCSHFNKTNKTGKTRISFDFRVMPSKFYDPTHEACSVTKGKRFVIGEYYACL